MNTRLTALAVLVAAAATSLVVATGTSPGDLGCDMSVPSLRQIALSQPLLGDSLAPEPPSYFEGRYNHVERDLMLFARAPQVGVEPIDVQREQDELHRINHVTGKALGKGMLCSSGMFGLGTIIAAHMPEKLRPIFDGPVHLGPAVMDGGGMGLGIGVRWL